MSSTGAQTQTGAVYDLRTQGRVGSWIVCGLIPVACFVAAVPGMYAAYFLGIALLYVGPVAGLVVIVGGAVRRRRIRRELLDSAVVVVAAAGAAAHSSLTDEDVEDVAGVADGHPPVVDRDEADRMRTVGEAGDFRLTRQITLFLCYAIVAATGIVLSIALALDVSWLSMLGLGPVAFLGLTLVCMAPSWALSRAVVAGEEHALATRTGSWRQIRALRILALVVGGVATAISAWAAVALPLGADLLPW
jgi:hypothetical protein